MIGIYCFRNIYSQKRYIGKSKDIEKRYKVHLRRAKNGEYSKFYCALRKYGINSFDFTVLCQCPISELDYWEKFYIKYYCSNIDNYGYNMTEGGTGTSVWTPEMIEKMSNSTIERFKNPDERDKASKAAIKRYEDPKERDKIRQEQFKRLEDKDYQDFLKEQGKIGSKKRWELYNNLSEKEKQDFHIKHSNACKNGWHNVPPDKMAEYNKNQRQRKLEYYKTHDGPTKGKHKVWNDEAHSGYHYE